MFLIYFSLIGSNLLSNYILPLLFFFSPTWSSALTVHFIIIIHFSFLAKPMMIIFLIDFSVIPLLYFKDGRCANIDDILPNKESALRQFVCV